jgi:hypothetical protein
MLKRQDNWSNLTFAYTVPNFLLIHIHRRDAFGLVFFVYSKRVLVNIIENWFKKNKKLGNARIL